MIIIFPIYGKKHVPNYQPGMVSCPNLDCMFLPYQVYQITKVCWSPNFHGDDFGLTTTRGTRVPPPSGTVRAWLRTKRPAARPQKMPSKMKVSSSSGPWSSGKTRGFGWFDGWFWWVIFDVGLMRFNKQTSWFSGIWPLYMIIWWLSLL